MLLHTGAGPSLLMSVPRDSIVDIPDRGTDKINAAFAVGGPKLLVRTMEQETGIRIDHFVEIGFEGLVRLVDAVGGITICPETAMDDPLAHLKISKGCQEVGRRRPRSATPGPGTPRTWATSTAPGTSVRWCPRSATRW